MDFYVSSEPSPRCGQIASLTLCVGESDEQFGQAGQPFEAFAIDLQQAFAHFDELGESRFRRGVVAGGFFQLLRLQEAVFEDGERVCGIAGEKSEPFVDFDVASQSFYGLGEVSCHPFGGGDLNQEFADGQQSLDGFSADFEESLPDFDQPTEVFVFGGRLVGGPFELDERLEAPLEGLQRLVAVAGKLAQSFPDLHVAAESPQRPGRVSCLRLDGCDAHQQFAERDPGLGLAAVEFGRMLADFDHSIKAGSSGFAVSSRRLQFTELKQAVLQRGERCGTVAVEFADPLAEFHVSAEVDECLLMVSSSQCAFSRIDQELAEAAEGGFVGSGHLQEPFADVDSPAQQRAGGGVIAVVSLQNAKFDEPPLKLFEPVNVLATQAQQSLQHFQATLLVCLCTGAIIRGQCLFHRLSQECLQSCQTVLGVFVEGQQPFVQIDPLRQPSVRGRDVTIGGFQIAELDEALVDDFQDGGVFTDQAQALLQELQAAFQLRSCLRAIIGHQR